MNITKKIISIFRKPKLELFHDGHAVLRDEYGNKIEMFDCQVIPNDDFNIGGDSLTLLPITMKFEMVDSDVSVLEYLIMPIDFEQYRIEHEA
jgi:hypothetical protein